MGIEQPTSNAKLPEKAKKALEDSHNKVTANEQEVINIKKTRRAEEYKIR